MLDGWDIALRLGVATLACGAIGLNRDLHGKPIGLRTLGMVGLATALAVLFVDQQSADPSKVSDATSRVIQGILTGIGFLGAGVIMRSERFYDIKGLTSAACVWLAACIGIVSGAGEWRLVAVALAIAFVLLLFGGPVERFVHTTFSGKKRPEPKEPDAAIKPKEPGAPDKPRSRD
ncbi:MAG: MgtC/SapB family protein [Afipia sp.]|jgi:putative Mg2+ transporter-C (MgtC) family protein